MVVIAMYARLLVVLCRDAASAQIVGDIEHMTGVTVRQMHLEDWTDASDGGAIIGD